VEKQRWGPSTGSVSFTACCSAALFDEICMLAIAHLHSAVQCGTVVYFPFESSCFCRWWTWFLTIWRRSTLMRFLWYGCDAAFCSVQVSLEYVPIDYANDKWWLT
jgi:hypothetical protein